MSPLDQRKAVGKSAKGLKPAKHVVRNAGNDYTAIALCRACFPYYCYKPRDLHFARVSSDWREPLWHFCKVVATLMVKGSKEGQECTRLFFLSLLFRLFTSWIHLVLFVFSAFSLFCMFVCLFLYRRMLWIKALSLDCFFVISFQLLYHSVFHW